MSRWLFADGGGTALPLWMVPMVVGWWWGNVAVWRSAGGVEMVVGAQPRRPRRTSREVQRVAVSHALLRDAAMAERRHLVPAILGHRVMGPPLRPHVGAVVCSSACPGRELSAGLGELVSWASTAAISTSTFSPEQRAGELPQR